MKLLEQVQDYKSGQTIDEVRKSAIILSGIATPITQVQAICVKLIFIPSILGNMEKIPYIGPNKLEKINQNGRRILQLTKDPVQQRLAAENQFDKDPDLRDPLKELNFEDIDKSSYVSTFKIYRDTTFDDIKKGACEFWQMGANQQDWVLTDEYYNNLSTFKDTVQNFYEESSGYQPLNPQTEACVYLIRLNNERQELNFL